jgi:SPP1 family predicted phage head-tail adaptor
MRAGLLRHRIEIQSPTLSVGDSGETVQDWDTIENGAVWGSVEPLKARELMESGRQLGEVTHRIRCRYVAGVSPKCRVLHGARVYQIESVINGEERGIMLEMLAFEVLS